MKKTILLLMVLMSFAAASAFGQGVVVTLGDIPANKTKGGKMAAIYTTSDRIMKSGKLVANAPDCEITSFLFSVVVGDNAWQIPVKGAQLTEAAIKKLKDTKGPGVMVLFDDIKVKQVGVVRTAHPLSFKYDQ